jgi:hypothetical protein
MTNNGIYLYLFEVNGRSWNIFIWHASSLPRVSICLHSFLVSSSILFLGHNRGETGIEAAFSIEKEAELGYTLQWGKEIMFNLRRGEFCSHLGMVSALS